MKHVLTITLIALATSASAHFPNVTPAELCATPLSPPHPDAQRDGVSTVRYLQSILVNCTDEPFFCPVEGAITSKDVAECEAVAK